MRRTAKAIVAGLVAGIGFAIPASDGGFTVAEGLGVALAAVVAYQGVFWTGPKGGRVDPDPVDPA